MRVLFLKKLLGSSRSTHLFTISAVLHALGQGHSAHLPHCHPRSQKRLFSLDRPGVNWSLAGRGIIVKDKVFQNLSSSDLQKHGAKAVAPLSGFPIFVRGDVYGTTSTISKPQFIKLLKQVTTHLSAVSNIFLQDGAMASPLKHGAKVRVISDSPSAAFSLSKVLWNISDRAVSRDSSPLTVYVATSISPKTGEIVGLGLQTSDGFIAADVERSSLILCGKAFADMEGIKAVLTALSSPVILARGGIPLSGRVLIFGDHVVLLFASDETIEASSAAFGRNMMSADLGTVLWPNGVSHLFPASDNRNGPTSNPSSLVFASADSSGAIPTVARISPGQAAYHFLAGYQEGKFVPAFSFRPCPISPVHLAEALFVRLIEGNIPSFVVNVYRGGDRVSGEELLRAVESTLNYDSLEQWESASSDPKVEDLKDKYEHFISSKFPGICEEFIF
ncbi:uncharacterized protein LOC144708510 [Wolffia australiana]